MSDTAHLIVVKPAHIGPRAPEVLRDTLGFAKSIHSYASKFRRCNFSFWIGAIGNCVVIDCFDVDSLIRLLPDGSLQPAGKILLDRLVQCFPNASIAALYFDDRVGYFGYAVFERGKLIRGCQNDGAAVSTAVGASLPFEVAYRSQRPADVVENGEGADAAIDRELAERLFSDFSGCDMYSETAQGVVGVGFSEGPLRFDPKTLLADFVVSGQAPQRRGQQGLPWRGMSLVLGALALIWLLLILGR